LEAHTVSKSQITFYLFNEQPAGHLPDRFSNQKETTMYTKLKTTVFAAAVTIVCLALSTLTSMAEDYQLGDLSIQHVTAKATLPNAPVSGGYMLITNNGESADRLLTASAEFAGKTEIHEMKMENEVMQMRQLADGLEIPAGGKVVLKPGGYHVMFMGLKEPLKEGEMRNVVLVFERAGTIEVEFAVKTADAISRMEHSN